MAKIGSLTADLKLESAAFIRDMRKAAQETARSTSQMQMGMAALQKQAASLGTAMKGFLTIQGIRGLVNLGSAAVKLADDIGDAATAIGVGAEELQRLRYAAEQSDVEVGQLDAALKLFQKNVATGKIASQSFEEFIQKIREAESHTEKVKVAVGGLGKQFQIGLLLAATSAEEFNRLMAEAPVITNKAVAAADQLTKEFLKFQDSITKGFTTGFVEEFADGVTGTGDAIKGVGEAAEELGRILARIFALGSNLILTTINQWKAWKTAITEINELIPKIPIPSWMGGADADSTAGLGIKSPAAGLAELAKKNAEEGAAAAELTKQQQAALNHEWEVATHVVKNELTPALAELHETMEDVGNKIASSFAAAIVEGKNFQEVINDLMQDIAKMIIQMLLAAAIKRSIDAGFSAATGVPVANFHEGGIVGREGGSTRKLPALAFVGAPRFHSGMMPGEFPAVLKKGEGVFTPGQMSALGRGGDVNINIDNRNGSDVQASGKRDENGDINIEVVIDQVVGRKLLEPGAASNRAMKQGFGVQPAGIRR